MLTRVMLLAAIIAAVLVVAQGASPVPPLPVSAQGVERTEFRHAPPSCEEIVNSPQWKGKSVNCIESPPATYDPPRLHGEYRLYPGSYVGPLTYEDRPDNAPPGVVSDELEAIRTSSLYVEPAWLPEGYALSSINTNGYDSEHVILTEYAGPGDPIHINRIRRATWPIDIIYADGESDTVFETPTIAGKEAVLQYEKAGSSWADSEFSLILSFVEGDVETIVYGAGLDPNTATQIALSLICGVDCVAEPPAEAGGTGGSSADIATGKTGTGTPATAAPGTPAAIPYALAEHRVISGLGWDLTSVQVSNPWHGFDYAPGAEEAALDLQHPAGGGAHTAGLPVLVKTWRAAGTGQIKFKAINYRIATTCDGFYVEVKGGADNYLGRLTYVHLQNQQPFDMVWYSEPGAWTLRYLGDVAASQVYPCPYSYEGAHLHQGQRYETLPSHISYNSALGGTIYPASDPVNNWMHRVSWTDPDPIDSDGDGCSDQEELDMGFNPLAWYDVFDVPKPAVADPTPNGIRNGVVDIGDVLAVLFYTFADDNGPPNASGVDYDSVKGSCLVQGVISEEGLCYDRTAGDPPTPQGFDPSGPPNGVIDMADVITALTQANQVDCSQPP